MLRIGCKRCFYLFVIIFMYVRLLCPFLQQKDERDRNAITYKFTPVLTDVSIVITKEKKGSEKLTMGLIFTTEINIVCRTSRFRR